jgi:hypothetical protein
MSKKNEASNRTVAPQKIVGVFIEINFPNKKKANLRAGLTL